MTLEEFETRTGIYPTQNLYKVIEEYYYKTPCDKDEFCDAYKNNVNGLANEIRNKADADDQAARDDMQQRISSLMNEVVAIKKQYDRELEWKPYELADNVKQIDYEKLKNSGRLWDDEEAKMWLSDDYGFAPDKIVVLHSVPIYEINRHGQLRTTGETERLPLYGASDWNYVRFDCGLMSYELDNGTLRFFSR